MLLCRGRVWHVWFFCELLISLVFCCMAGLWQSLLPAHSIFRSSLHSHVIFACDVTEHLQLSTVNCWNADNQRVVMNVLECISHVLDVCTGIEAESHPTSTMTTVPIPQHLFLPRQFHIS